MEAGVELGGGRRGKGTPATFRAPGPAWVGVAVVNEDDGVSHGLDALEYVHDELRRSLAPLQEAHEVQGPRVEPRLRPQARPAQGVEAEVVG